MFNNKLIILTLATIINVYVQVQVQATPIPIPIPIPKAQVNVPSTEGLGDVSGLLSTVTGGTQIVGESVAILGVGESIVHGFGGLKEEA